MKKSLVIVILFFVGVFTANAQADSLGIEKEGEKVFVLHKVKAKQTLWSLSQRYGTTVKAINDENPVLSNGLQIGQTLKIPYGKEIKETVVEEVSNTTEEVTTHEVKAGETLWSIGTKYGVKVTDIKAWNKLETNALALGQELVIKKEVVVAEGAKAPEQITQTEEAVEEIQEIVTTEQAVQEDTTVQYQGTPFQQHQVEGVAEVIEEDEPSTKFFCLHRTAKEGTVIKVRNLMNDITVYVRVIGKIPETSNNENVLIKINQRAYDNLKAIDKRFRVEISYFQ